jgi:phage terminase small subunit
MTPRQERFVQEYLIDLNATQAAIRAGYSAKTANAQAGRLLVNVSVHNAIRDAQKERSDRTQITAERVIQELARIAFVNPRKIFKWGPNGVTLLDSDSLTEDEAAAVAEVSETTTESGGSIKAKLHDKNKALELLGKHLGIFTDKLQVQHSGEMSMQAQIRAVLLEREK